MLNTLVCIFQSHVSEVCGVRCWLDEDCSKESVCEEGLCIKDGGCRTDEDCQDVCFNGSPLNKIAEEKSVVEKQMYRSYDQLMVLKTKISALEHKTILICFCLTSFITVVLVRQA